MIDDLLEAGEDEGEPGLAAAPLDRDYRRNIESSVADVKNIGDRWGGAITAALFLKEFVGDVPWAHLDVAGTGVHRAAERRGPRGDRLPARTLIRYMRDRRPSQRAGR